jgi:hypothetical protein
LVDRISNRSGGARRLDIEAPDGHAGARHGSFEIGIGEDDIG